MEIWQQKTKIQKTQKLFRRQKTQNNKKQKTQLKKQTFLDHAKPRRAMHFLKNFSFSKMRSEGFWFNSGGLEVGVVFAQRCFHGGKMAAVREPSLTVRRRSQSVTKSPLGGRFRRKIAWFCCFLWHALRSGLRFAWQAQYFRSVFKFACRFYVAGAPLRVAASCNFRGRRSESQRQGCTNMTQR